MGTHAYRGRTELDGFERVFNLEQTTFRGEGAGGRLAGARSEDAMVMVSLDTPI